MTAKDAPAITELVCTCGEKVSGPDAKSVKDTMERHEKKHAAKPQSAGKK